MSSKSRGMVLYLVLVQLFFMACRKDKEVYVPANLPTNPSLKSVAGKDTVMQLKPFTFSLSGSPGPCAYAQDTIFLDGSRSINSDGTINAYKWRFLHALSLAFQGSIIYPEGNPPDYPAIINDKHDKAKVVVNRAGTYWFSLTVTDNKGNIATDSIKWEIKPNAEDVKISRPLSEFSSTFIRTSDIDAVTSFEDRIFFKNEFNADFAAWDPFGDPPPDVPARITVYDIPTKNISTIAFTDNRFGVSMVLNENKLFLSGGFRKSILSGQGELIKEMDIIDLRTGIRQTIGLEKPQAYAAAFSIGHKLVFTGGLSEYKIGVPGQQTDIVEIYDIPTNTWKTSRLSQVRFKPEMIEVDGKLVILGGIGSLEKNANSIDIYDPNTDTWTTSTLALPRINYSLAVLGNKLYCAESYNAESFHSHLPVEIWDINTGKSDFLCSNNGFQELAVCGNSLVLSESRNPDDGSDFNRLVKYDPATGKFTIFQPPAGKYFELSPLHLDHTRTFAIARYNKDTYNISEPKLVELDLK